MLLLYRVAAKATVSTILHNALRLIATLFASSISFNLAHAQMATPGQFDVTSTGAAQYTIPIAVPPGTAGMVPNLALVYNSQGGNGLLGMGWSLSGLSAITRCPRTSVQDSSNPLVYDGTAKKGIQYDASDKYCLDGQRLVASSGSYGADGTVYHTERESFSKIVSYGSNGYGPTSFKVWTKAGQILEYGTTADSAIEAQGKTAIRVWAVDKITDVKGNYLTFTYAEDNPNGQYYPSRIDYTGNTTTGLLPYNSIQFTYVTRTDIVPQYQMGSLINNTMLLTNVQTYTGTTLVKDYRLAYDTLGTTGRSRLSGITEYSGDGIPLIPTIPAYTTETASTRNFTGAGSGNWTGTDASIASGFKSVEADFNGDGLADIYISESIVGGHGSANLSKLCLSTGGIFLCNSETNVPMFYVNKGGIGDFNGDGKSEFVGITSVSPSRSMYQWGASVCLSSGAAFSCSTWVNNFATTYGASSATLLVGDFNGDGLSDIVVYISTGTWQMCLSTGSSMNCSAWSGPTADVANNAVGDFNGDGKADLAGYVSGNNWNVCLSTGNGFTCSTWTGTGTGPTGTITGDFNGDGLADLASNVSGSTWNVCLSTGVGFNCSNWDGVSAAVSATRSGDFNGDGKTDIAASLGSGVWNVCLSDGTAFSCSNWSGTTAAVGYTYVGDFNGDGKSDFTGYLGGSTWNTALSADPFPDRLSSITTGLGTATLVGYSPLSNWSGYTKESSATYPVQDMQAPLYVVSSTSSSNGIGGLYTNNYTYTGAKTHLKGGGFLGFHTTTVTDAQSGINSKTTYLQDYPHQGLPSSVEKHSSAGVLLNQVSNTWAYTTNPTWGNQYHVPLLTQSIVTGNDLNGAPLPTVTTTTAAPDYDACGNAKVINVIASDGYSKTTTNTYSPDPIDAVNCYLNRLTKATVTSTSP